MRVSAIDALQRGLLNLRANSALVLLQLAQGVVVALFTLAGLAPLALALGAGAVRAFWNASQRGWVAGGDQELERLISESLADWPILAAALLAAGAIWTVGFLVYCWFQAGVLGQLAAGEERAATAPGSPAAADFRVYSWVTFSRLANSGVWKFFWLINLYLIVGTVLVFLFVLGLTGGLLLFGAERGLAVVITLGCLLGLVLFFAFFLLFGWSQIGKAELAVKGDGVVAAFRRSLVLFGRRLGAVLLLLVLFITASVALSIVFLPLSLGLDIALGDSFARQMTADGAVMVIQSAVNAALTAALSASLIALVRAEP